MISKNLLSLFICLGLLINVFSQEKYKTFFVKGFSNNKLEVLDWGGKGKPIIFLAGCGNTPHNFEDFAPRFTNNYHVYGITRRGFGNSERVNVGFSTDTLLQDIIKVMDSLQLKKVILIGHSIAGDELSTFARQYPNKVSAIVFLDAALDHAGNFDSLLAPFPKEPRPDSTFKPTLKNIQDDYFKTHRFSFPDGELNTFGKFDKNGLFVEDTTAMPAYFSVLKLVKTISYKGIKCPSLAIYNNAPTAPERFRTYALLDSANKKIAEECTKRWYKYYQVELERYKSECKGCLLKEIRNSHHQIFLCNPKETELAIKNFLKQL
jgi:pimeloyl-ACP methyl ester carboxylesterase